MMELDEVTGGELYPGLPLLAVGLKQYNCCDVKYLDSRWMVHFADSSETRQSAQHEQILILFHGAQD